MEIVSLSEIAKFVQDRAQLNVTEEVSELGTVIGEGAFGKVHPATWSYSPAGSEATERPKRIPVVVKILDGEVVKGMQWSDETVWKLTTREFQSWFRITPHDNVLPVIGIYFGTTSPGLVVPRVEEPDITRWLVQKEANDGGLSFKRRCELALDIAYGLAHLHSMEINLVHGDLHRGNIFVHQERAVVADFGLSKLAGTITTSAFRPLRDYLAAYEHVPELATNPFAPRTQQTDIYMFGVIAQDIFSWGFSDERRKEEALENELLYLRNRCCARDPLERPCASDIIQQLESFKASRPDTSFETDRSRGSRGAILKEPVTVQNPYSL